MSIFAGLDFDTTIKADEDRVGGGYVKFDKTGAFDVVIEKAYVTVAKSGAIGVVINFKREDGAKLKVTEWMTNKIKQNYYLDKDGNKRYLAGYNAVMSIDRIVTGKTNTYPTAEKRIVPIWNNELKKETNQEVDALIEWTGKPVTILVHKVLVNKQALVDDKYVDVAGTIEKVEIKHVVDVVSHKTKNEIVGGLNAEFFTKWTEKFKDDYIDDKRSILEDEPTTSSTNADSFDVFQFGA